MSDHIYASGQERWYKFQVTPGSLVHISYQGDPGAIVSLHSDMQVAYSALTVPTNAAVESATRASSGFLPQSFLPQSFLPQSFLPQSFLPQSFLPQSFLPQSFLPGPYSGAIDSSLLTLSAIPNSSTQTIDHFTWNGSGSFYVRVVGPVDRNNAFQVTITETAGVCGGTSPIRAIPATQPSGIPTGKTSLILWDSSRIALGTAGGLPFNISTLSSKLNTFASRPEVNGAVVDLSGNSGVEAAEAQADSNPGCPAAKNVVADDIMSVIQAYRAQNLGLRYIVLVGDDHSIPFFRYPDMAGLGPENQYYPPVADTSALNASLRNNYVLGQDEYGASVDLPIGALSLPIPDLAVGRLVSTAAEVSHMLDVYTGASGTLTPGSSLVTGYDFVADAACNARADLVAGMPAGATIDTLIQQGSQPLASPCPASSTAWTASDLSQKLLGNRHDIVFMAGHFSAGGLEASDYATSLSAATVASSPVDMTDTLVLALGCHGGYNIPGGDAVSNFSPSPDWPEAFAQKGATLLAATGYAYGDTDLTEYGEHLFDNYVKQLRSYSGASYVPVAVGQANVAAKKEYLATHTNLSGVDEKTLLETTLYGLPMMTVNMTGQHISTQPDTSIVSSAPTVSSGPGVNFGTGSADIDVQPSLTSHTQTLTNSATNTSVTATYLSGPNNSVVARPGEPIFPSQVYNVQVSNQILRGVGFRGGSYSDTTGITPLTSAAGTETSVGHPAFYTNVFYPTQVWTPNYFGAVGGGSEHLAITPAQYISANPTSTSGTLRQFSDLKFRLFYLPSTWTSNTATIPVAEAAAPTISSVSATPDSSGNVTFAVHVLSDQLASGADTQGVWITYTDPSHPGTWQSIDLAPDTTDPTLWKATQPLSSSIVFMVQAVNGTGLVTLSTNSGAYYAVGSATPPSLAPTTISVQSPPPASGVFQTSSSFNVQLQSNGTALANQPVTVSLGGQQGLGTTNSSGIATITVPLAQPPGTYNLTASFAGGSGYQASTQTLSGAFQITPAPTTLTLTPSSTSMPRAASVPITATLQDGGGNGLAQKPIVFTVSGNGLTYQSNVFTDSSGRAQLGLVSLPAGSYSVTAAFGGQNQPLKVTLGGNMVTEQDPDYATPGPPPAVSLTLYQYQPAGTTCDGDAGHAILQPVNADGSSAFKQGRTVPLKFRVCDANGNSVGPTAAASTVVAYFAVANAKANCSSCTVDETINSTTPDTAFRWDSTSMQWIYNLSTKNLVSGTSYFYDIALNDGTHIDFNFAVK
ncbi:MAG: PxKF domain-containing protein [Chloroflexi bacterium]|nr:PxKF domain-containing protein [Chloroflexota bacterium]